MSPELQDVLPYLVLSAWECLALVGIIIGFIIEGKMND